MFPLLFPLLALIAGIVASSSLEPQAVWLCLPLAILLGLAQKKLLLIAVFLAGAGLRSLDRPVQPLPPGEEASRVIGTLSRRPDWRGPGVYLDLHVESIDGTPYRGGARLTEFLDNPEQAALFRVLDLATGDRVEILVRLKRPANYRDPGVFDFRRYLEREGVFWTGTIRNPRLITVLKRGPGFLRALDRLHYAIEAKLSRLFEGDPNTRGLVLGMVLGRKHDLTSKVESDFQASGLYHLVVVSGFNLAVIASAMSFLSRFLVARRNWRLLLVVVAVIAYSMLVGVQPPVMRATLMVGILAAGTFLDRNHPPLNTIALAALLLLAANPGSLEDASFQMTFSAVTAIVGIGAPASRWMLKDLQTKLHDFDNADLDGFLPPQVADWRVSRRMLCEIHRLPHWFVTIPWRLFQIAVDGLIMSLAVELVFVVFMVESFHRLSPISPLLNIPAGLIAAVVTPLGLLLILIPDPITMPIAGIVRGLLELLMALTDSTLALPFASLRVPSVPVWLWFLYAVSVGLLTFGVHRQERVWFGLGFAAALALQTAIVLMDFTPDPPEAVTVTILDVGQGDCILVEFPDGRRVLIDGGGVTAGRFLGLQDQSTFSIGEEVVSAYLFSRRIRRLDTVVLTHAHNDHLSGLFEVLDNFKVGEIWLGRNPMIPAYRAFIHQAQEHAIPLRFVSEGDHLGEFEVLHPPAHWRVRNSAENNDSVVLLLRSGQQTALFTGDLELPLPGIEFANLLKVSHHGSKGVRMRVNSDVRVISVGANNPFGHPHPSTLPALRTDVLGAIQVKLQGPRPVVEWEP